MYVDVVLSILADPWYEYLSGIDGYLVGGSTTSMPENGS